ncbi:MAG: polyprenyl synthetase family protein [Magnetococcales bacterium]|nr:polyprenyl synthetase family protein [Magnetococcales bacterium]
MTGSTSDARTEEQALAHYLSSRKALVEEALEALCPWEQAPASRLTAAMRHSLMDGGKRLRPILVLACAEALGNPPTPYLPFACAMECIHTYSLIHDDLPAMDNDDLRRGRPTCHKQFDEATAILAGDALLTLAFEWAAQPIAGVEPQESLALIQLLAQGAGMRGMVGGQMLDMLSEKKQISMEELQLVHACKTGALIQVACVAGARLGGATVEQRQNLAEYGAAIGLAFQIIDDILDETGDSQLLGKATGQDRQSLKATYPRLLGLAGSWQEAERQVTRAIAALEPFSNQADPLRQLARFILTRKH